MVDEAVKKELGELFGRHVVALTWWEGVPNGNGGYKEKAKFWVASGFVMEIFDHWWLVTAGHVTIDHMERKSKDGIVAFEPRIWDCFGSEQQTSVPIPFDFFDYDAIAFEDYSPSRGIDYSMIHIPLLVGKALEQTILPIGLVD